MPTLSVFIRKEDVAKWKAIPNKSEWLHAKLNGQQVPLNSKPLRAPDSPDDTTVVPFYD